MSNFVETKIGGRSLDSMAASAGTVRAGFADNSSELVEHSLRRDLAREAASVLLVMADSGERDQLAKTLTNLGCRVLIAVNGETSFRIASSEQPGLVVIETELPGRDGFQVCAELRLDDSTRHIPVMLVSQSLAAEDKMRGLRLGAVDCIAKPCDWLEVAAQACSQLELGRVRSELVLANVNLLAEQAQRRAELKAAAAVQKSLLPRFTTENFADLTISWRFLPLDQVGGDLLGYAWLDEEHLAAYVVDVCGHGLSAAMMTAAISISLAPSVEAGEGVRVKQFTAFSPKQMLEKLDREYPIERFDRPFTISYLVFNRKTGEFRCSRAGHPMPIVIRRAGQIESVEAGGTIIGLDRMLPFEEGVGKLGHGDSILLYSDGVTECRNTSDSYGLDRLYRILRRSYGCSAEILCENIMADLLHFNAASVMQDDVSVLALTYGALL
jgi:phosphoserine phosphatase RsbU/P